MLKIYNFVVFQ